MSAIAGRVLLIPKGNYDSTATYTMLDMVVYNGSSYICKQECTGVVPTNTTYWMLNASGSAVAYINDIGDVVITNPTNEQVLMYNSTTQEWVNGTLTLNKVSDIQFASLSDGQVLKYNATSQKWENAEDTGGLLPHLIIISETGESVVKAVKGTTEIIATETSTGHYECDVPEFGTWTIHAILGGDDATVNLVVDTVKVYTVDDSHFHADITVKYPSGATCSCSKTGETTLYATGSPYTFTVHSSGTWTITVTVDGKTYTQTVSISTSGQTESLSIPDGATITPTDNIGILLHCAGIGGSSIATLADLLADRTSLWGIISSNNAIDYLVRSTSFASDVCASASAMTYIGLNNYASNTLLADSTWRNAICNSTYFESVLNDKVPTMTSATTPSGECFSSSNVSTSSVAYKAFDGNSSTRWYPISNNTNNFIGYKFTESKKMCVVKLKYSEYGTFSQRTFKIQGSNDGTNYTDVDEFVLPAHSGSTEDYYDFVKSINNSNNYMYYRLFTSDVLYVASTYVLAFYEIQFYGRADV